MRRKQKGEENKEREGKKRGKLRELNEINVYWFICDKINYVPLIVINQN